MRTPLLATALGLSLAGCLTIGDSGTAPNGGDDDTGSSTGSNTGSNATPGVNVTTDRATVTTELGKAEVVTLTFTSVNSFTGSVTVTPSLVDGTGVALTTGGLTVAGPTSVSVAASAPASAMYTVTIPTDATATQMTADLKLDVASSAGTKSVTSAFTIAPTYSLTYAAGLAANLAMHPLTGLKVSLKKGAKISLHNADTIVHVTHGDGGFKHEDIPTGGQPGATYVIDTSQLAVGTMGQVGCHSHSGNNNETYATVTIK
ncbi:MAG TPA: hypothetical protein VHT91_24950 [Kofleriaceae bacterium]|jgi:hypothetical protein|nr:hypothetical protein [Kofleriaceae bacterium]